jgi:LEA14-like dessication related protein|tara:strand:- start:168 stop:629 length:462 start_codon:yes stop_codon:yes gene_type:complete
MQSFLKIFTLVSIVFLLQSCIAFKDLEYKGIDSYEVEEISMSGVKLSLSVKIENPNWFKIKARGGEIDVKLGGNSLGKFMLADEVILPKKSDGVILVRVESKFKSFLGGGLIGIMSMIQNGGEVEIELEGHIKAHALGVTKKIPISTKEKIRL